MTMAGDNLDPAREALIAEGFRGSRQPMILVDVDGHVAAASAGVAELAGVSREVITGSACADWFLPEGAVGQCTLLGGCQGGLRRQAQLRNVNGELIPVEIVCSSFHAEPLPGTGAGAAPDDDVRRHCFFHVEDIRRREHDDQVRAARQAKLPLLNQVSEALYGAHLTLDQLQQAILICVTAGQGLRFNRAFLLLVDDAGTILRGELAIGPSNHEEAARIWHDLADRPADLFEMMTSYDQSIKNTNAAVNEIVRKMVVSLDRTDHILVRAMHERRVARVTGDMTFPGADELRGWLGGGQFAVAPLTIRSGPVGVIVADNAISGQEISDLDLEFLQMFANQSAAAVENSRLYRELEKRLVDLRRAHHQQKEDQQTLLRMERLSVMGETSAIVAHELRNPLVGIGGFARTLMRNLDETDPNHRFAAIISEEVARMEEIIHDLLDFIRPRKMLRQETVIDVLVNETAERFRGELEGAGVQLTIEPGCGELALECHPGEVQQVLQNYLMNALQAQALGGQVIVRTSALEGGLKVEVLDSGPGFADADGKRLFSPFFSTKPTGSGLGLTICAQIIKAHGGVTGAANRPEGGATFWFILPLPRS
jgi:signal transduction histidine kinase